MLCVLVPIGHKHNYNSNLRFWNWGTPQGMRGGVRSTLLQVTWGCHASYTIKNMIFRTSWKSSWIIYKYIKHFRTSLMTPWNYPKLPWVILCLVEQTSVQWCSRSGSLPYEALLSENINVRNFALRGTLRALTSPTDWSIALRVVTLRQYRDLALRFITLRAEAS